MAEEPDEPYEPRPTLGCLLLVIPVAVLGFGVLAYLAVFVAGVRGRPAEGERVRIEFAACPEAVPLLRDRVELMGLGDPVYDTLPSGVAITARLPLDATDAAAIPATLARAGRFEVVDPSAPTPPIIVGERVDAATVDFGVDGIQALVRLDTEGAETLRKHMIAHPEGRVAYQIDGVTVEDRSNMPAEARGDLELTAPPGDQRTQLRTAAAWAVILDAGPLPCAVSVVGQPLPASAP